MQSLLKKISWKKWLLIALAWELIAFYFIFQNYIFSINAGTPFDWQRSLSYRLTNNLYWILLTPLLFYIGKKIKLEPGKIAKNILIVTGLGILISLAQAHLSIITSLFFARFYSVPVMPFWERIILAEYGMLGLAFDSFFLYFGAMSIIYGINYYRKNKEHQYNLSQLEARLAQAEVQAMKMQLHPHFLFNTLHAISTLMHRDPNAADKMITQLSNLLRISLDNIGVQEVLLRDELNFLEQYIEIQKMRFQDSLEIKMDIAPETFNIQVPNLILQPIVENAFKHGVEEISGEKRINITSRLENKMLMISVEDNGPGTKEVTGEASQAGLGLKNTRERLRQLYGSNSELVIENSIPKGLIVKLNIPIK